MINISLKKNEDDKLIRDSQNRISAEKYPNLLLFLNKKDIAISKIQILPSVILKSVSHFRSLKSNNINPTKAMELINLIEWENDLNEDFTLLIIGKIIINNMKSRAIDL